MPGEGEITSENSVTTIDSPITFTEEQLQTAKTLSKPEQRVDYFNDILAEQLGLDSRLTVEMQPDVEIENGIPVDKVAAAYKLLFDDSLPDIVTEQFKLMEEENNLKTPGRVRGRISYKDLSAVLQTAGHMLDPKIPGPTSREQTRLPNPNRSLWQRLRGR